jgi:uncharacterized protein YbjQ (UPF0145 family)
MNISTSAGPLSTDLQTLSHCLLLCVTNYPSAAMLHGDIRIHLMVRILFTLHLQPFPENLMLVSNIEIIPGKRIVQHLGMVQGSTVRAKHVGRDIMASLKNIFGGELKGYTELLQESREEAVDRMVQQAKAIGANAVINVRFSTSSIAAGAAELFAYGTAVVLE